MCVCVCVCVGFGQSHFISVQFKLSEIRATNKTVEIRLFTISFWPAYLLPSFSKCCFGAFAYFAKFAHMQMIRFRLALCLMILTGCVESFRRCEQQCPSRFHYFPNCFCCWPFHEGCLFPQVWGSMRGCNSLGLIHRCQKLSLRRCCCAFRLRIKLAPTWSRPYYNYFIWLWCVLTFVCRSDNSGYSWSPGSCDEGQAMLGRSAIVNIQMCSSRASPTTES